MASKRLVRRLDLDACRGSRAIGALVVGQPLVEIAWPDVSGPARSPRSASRRRRAATTACRRRRPGPRRRGQRRARIAAGLDPTRQTGAAATPVRQVDAAVPAEEFASGRPSPGRRPIAGQEGDALAEIEPVRVCAPAARRSRRPGGHHDRAPSGRGSRQAPIRHRRRRAAAPAPSRNSGYAAARSSPDRQGPRHG